MERLTKKWGNNPAVPCKFNLDFIFDMNDKDCLELQAIFEKLAYYEDLEEQGRLEMCASKDKEVESLKKRCSICLFYIGERHDMSNPCDEKNCLIYRRLEELGQILI